jgi:hypothetical protein
MKSKIVLLFAIAIFSATQAHASERLQAEVSTPTNEIDVWKMEFRNNGPVEIQLKLTGAKGKQRSRSLRPGESWTTKLRTETVRVAMFSSLGNDDKSFTRGHLANDLKVSAKVRSGTGLQRMVLKRVRQF